MFGMYISFMSPLYTFLLKTIQGHLSIKQKSLHIPEQLYTQAHLHTTSHTFSQINTHLNLRTISNDIIVTAYTYVE